MRIPDYRAWYKSSNPSDFGADVMGVAEVEFSAPPHIRYPVFPVNTTHGLVFPSLGVAKVTAPEIAAAVPFGRRNPYHAGCDHPMDQGRGTPVLTFVHEMNAVRDRLKEACQPEAGPATLRVHSGEPGREDHNELALRKDRAGGASPQRVRLPIRDGSTATSSAVSNAAFAAYTTGRCARASQRC